MFATILHHLGSPENTGMIVRAHVAFGGEKLVIIGQAPWRFKKSTQAFSRRLEKICEIVHLPDDDSLFQWCQEERYTLVAIEISENPTYLPAFTFPKRPALVIGHESRGLSPEFLQRCPHLVTIPQFGPVACLNVAMSCGIALYELNRSMPVQRSITGHKFFVEESEKPENVEPIAQADRKG